MVRCSNHFWDVTKEFFSSLRLCGESFFSVGHDACVISLFGLEAVTIIIGMRSASHKATRKPDEIIAAARGEIEAAAQLCDARIRVIEVEGELEMHISANAQYGLSCPDAAAKLRQQILACVGDDVKAVHFFIRKLVFGRN